MRMRAPKLRGNGPYPIGTSGAQGPRDTSLAGTRARRPSRRRGWALLPFPPPGLLTVAHLWAWRARQSAGLAAASDGGRRGWVEAVSARPASPLSVAQAAVSRSPLVSWKKGRGRGGGGWEGKAPAAAVVLAGVQAQREVPRGPVARQSEGRGGMDGRAGSGSSPHAVTSWRPRPGEQRGAVSRHVRASSAGFAPPPAHPPPHSLVRPPWAAVEKGGDACRALVHPSRYTGRGTQVRVAKHAPRSATAGWGVPLGVWLGGGGLHG